MNNISYNEIMIALCLSMLIYNYGENKYFIIEDGHTLSDFYKYVDFHFDIYQRESLSFLYNKCPDGQIVKFINDASTDIQCAILKSNNKKKLYIVFRGTDSIIDCLHDSMCCQTFLALDDESINVGIHCGFYKQFEYIYEKIIDIICDFINDDYDIYLTGHSLAHSLSVILSYYLSDLTEKKIRIITFGGPKIGNYDWNKIYEEKKNLLLFRFTNESDIVPALPFLNYYHVGLNIHLTTENIELNTYNKFSFNIKDHSIVNYYNNLFGKEDIFNKLFFSL